MSNTFKFGWFVLLLVFFPLWIMLYCTGGDDDDNNNDDGSLVTIGGITFDTTYCTDLTRCALSIPTDSTWELKGYRGYEGNLDISFSIEMVLNVPCVKQNRHRYGSPIYEEDSYDLWYALATDGALYILKGELSDHTTPTYDPPVLMAPAEISMNMPQWTILGEVHEITGIDVQAPHSGYSGALEVTNHTAEVILCFVDGIGLVEMLFGDQGFIRNQ